MCRNSSQFNCERVLIARRIPGRRPGAQPRSEGLEPGAHEHRARLALLDPAVQEFVEQPDHGELLATRGAVPERRVEGRLAVRARGQPDLAARLDPVVHERVDEALAVVPLDVLGLIDVPRRLVHAGLAGVEHVLQVVRQQRPLVEVVLPAFLARDHDALHALDGEDRVHLREVGEVGLDVGALFLREVERLFGKREGFVHRITVAHGAGTSSSSSTNRRALNPSAYRYPFSDSAAMASARSRIRGSASAVPWETWALSASIFVSIVPVMSTNASASAVASQRFGTSNGSRPSPRSSGNIGRVGASGITTVSASRPACLWSQWFTYSLPYHSRDGSGATITSGRRRRTSRQTFRRVSRLTSSIPSTSPRKVTLLTPRISAAARCSRSRTGAISSRVLPGSFDPAEPSVMIT